MFFSSKKVIGIDIGSTSIKVIEVDSSRKGANLLSFAVVPTPPGAIYGGEIHDIAAIAMALQAAITELKTKRKNAATAMWGTAVIVKKIQMARVDRKLLREQVRFEAEQYIPFDLNNVSLAHHELMTNNSPETMDVLLVAAQNELVLQYSQVIETAGLNCSILDVSGFALANCFELNYGKRPETVGILNFGASITNFVVIQNGEILFARDILAGGSSYTNEIHKILGVTVEEAEALKLSASAGREVPDEVHSILSQTNEVVVEEIRSSLDFLAATSSEVSIQKFYFTGGAALTPGLIETASRGLGLSFEPLNPFVNLKANPKKFSPGYLDQIHYLIPVSLGLGLREVGDA
ncbi:MAG: type IV pilus assembly protein PilM [Bdellovibrionia bacterium]